MDESHLSPPNADEIKLFYLIHKPNSFILECWPLMIPNVPAMSWM